ncbi:MAG TPA: BCCT family transporter [Arenicellales bacterium]|nr:BCCT family transporter [Arenicellales bacterium]
MSTNLDNLDTYRFKLGTKGIFKDVNPPMATLAKLIVVVFLTLGAAAPEAMGSFFSGLQDWISANLGWYYILAMCLFMFFVFFLIVTPYGRIRLGNDHERPEFGNFAWFSMLFGAGMGIGLLFWSVAEPMYHIQNSPFLPEGAQTSMAGAVPAMQTLWLHWGLHAWAVYVIVGMALAYYSYRWNLPLTIRASLYPLLGERIYGPIGHTIDLLAIFGTVFGVATTLGLGAGQINAGLSYIFDAPDSLRVKIWLIMGISVIATFSAVSGVGRGIKWLSVLNMWLSIILITLFVIVGPTVFLLGFFITNLGEYLDNFIQWGAYVGSGEDATWQGWWTVFYWGWWMAWAPFVGMFIARVSRGRTIREFCVGVLVVPTLITFFWFAIMGGTGLYQEFNGGGTAGLIAAVNEDISRPLFLVIENLDVGMLGTVMSFMALILIVTYFVTSSDSGTLVVTTLISMGKEQPPVSYRVFWGIGEGAVAAILLYAGGLKALQTASLALGAPFSIIMFLMMYSLLRSFQADLDEAPAPGKATTNAT